MTDLIPVYPPEKITTAGGAVAPKTAPTSKDHVSDFFAATVINVGLLSVRAVFAADTRLRVLISNRHAVESIYLGDSQSVTIATGFLIAAGESLEVESRADVYLIAGAVNDAVHLLQEYRSV